MPRLTHIPSKFSVLSFSLSTITTITFYSTHQINLTIYPSTHSKSYSYSTRSSCNLVFISNSPDPPSSLSTSFCYIYLVASRYFFHASITFLNLVFFFKNYTHHSRKIFCSLYKIRLFCRPACIRMYDFSISSLLLFDSYWLNESSVWSHFFNLFLVYPILILIHPNFFLSLTTGTYT
ncbi:hypothetical protein K435DRAFT_327716 [Dendrothele bispora CBS 962.96]|uniref:Uncharacterized protein n=1 Tax=Dendrothele bispora (strain CBS 962.96) TaxID=1314807 RepID=A0A4S8MVV7_DENBC|nr:hypothetical protein K435DRAFT_327716 [Dendrothele bispora CBS 962.96]